MSTEEIAAGNAANKSVTKLASVSASIAIDGAQADSAAYESVKVQANSPTSMSNSYTPIKD